MDKRLQSNNDSLTQIVTELGTEMKGTHRTRSGSIVFMDQAKLDKYLRQKEIISEKNREIDDLKAKVDMLLQLVTKDNK